MLLHFVFLLELQSYLICASATNFQKCNHLSQARRVNEPLPRLRRYLGIQSPIMS